jgi:hypothetical protein
MCQTALIPGVEFPWMLAYPSEPTVRVKALVRVTRPEDERG